MVRGCQKRIYYIKNPHSALFAEAYFVLKNDNKTLLSNTLLSETSLSDRKLAVEAERIVNDMERRDKLTCPPPQYSPIGQRIGAFVIGAASSSAVIGGIALLLAFA